MFYLTFPIVVLYILVVLLVVIINPSENLQAYLAALAIITIFIVLVEAHIFRTRIVTELDKVDKITKLLKEQERTTQLLMSQDLELRKANEKLKELDIRKSEFLSVVAHQLRTPLSGIKWTLNMMLSGDLGALTADQQVFLMKGYESNQRMIGLVEDMLGADRVSSGKLEYMFASVQIGPVIDSILYDIMPFANKKTISLKLEGDPSKLPKVNIDADKIRGVFQNLLENAIKYTPQNGTITIGSTIDNGFVKISVKDSGIGIGKSYEKSIFTRFFRAPNAIKLETDGSGLGLYIAKSIVEKHGGKIWFESEEGKGTTFYFTLKIG